MRRGHTRRAVLAGSGAIAVGGVGLGGAAAHAAASPHAKGTEFRIAMVDAVHGSHVSVKGDPRSLRLECVPPGWQAAVGDKVVVGPSPDSGDVTAQQLSHWTVYSAPLAEVVPGKRLGGTAGPLVTQVTSITPALAARRGASGTLSRLGDTYRAAGQPAAARAAWEQAIVILDGVRGVRYFRSG
jgi:hypothetical protein